MAPSDLPPLTSSLPALILGGAGFSDQTHPDPSTIPVADIILAAFEAGLLAIDTSPFYAPSETLIGTALASATISTAYPRSSYVLMTKVGRTGPESYDYSPGWVRLSVERSVELLRTEYLDVVFCHDMEAVTDEDVLGAVEVLLDFVKAGKVRAIGLSSYRIDLLVRRAEMVRERFGRPVDAVQNWGQLNLQNSRLEADGEEGVKAGLAGLRAAGVTCVFSGSPLNIGLLRDGGVPKGRLGDFHPAPEGLRDVAGELALTMKERGESLAALALRYSVWRAHEAEKREAGGSLGFRVCNLTGISAPSDLDENVKAAKMILRGDLRTASLDEEQIARDKPLFQEARGMFGKWLDWSYTIPAEGWSQELKKMVTK